MSLNKLYSILCVVVVLLWAGTVNAQPAPYECDDNFDECGTPQQSGGGGGGGGGSILINNTDLGDSYQYADDYDDDGIEDPYDNCPFVENSNQADDDGDGYGTACDNCPNVFNVEQLDIDADWIGNVCDGDIDGDGFDNGQDLCPENPDPLQYDTDEDGIGNACDDDMDDDGVLNLEDNCPLVYNPEQSDDDPGLWGDACDNDSDGDGIRDLYDNCDYDANYDQIDLDVDDLGNVCDSDMDGDGIINSQDNCPAIENPEQKDLDRDGIGEACDDLYCYVVMDDVENCLNPEDIYTVYSPGLTVETGEDIRLRLFANRVNQPLNYHWEIVEAPSGSSATIKNPKGAASVSTPYEYHYLQDRLVTFEADRPGTYKVRVVAEQVWEDEVTGQAGVSAEAYSYIVAAGDVVGASACSTVAVGGNSGLGGGTLLVILLGLAFTLSRRESR